MNLAFTLIQLLVSTPQRGPWEPRRARTEVKMLASVAGSKLNKNPQVAQKHRNLSHKNIGICRTCSMHVEGRMLSDPYRSMIARFREDCLTGRVNRVSFAVSTVIPCSVMDRAQRHTAAVALGQLGASSPDRALPLLEALSADENSDVQCE
eukprot:3475473-Amphidinium_carterae.1